MKERLDQAKNEGLKIIYVDEAMFTFKTMPAKTWSAPYNNLKIVESQFRMKSQALVCGISEEDGVEHFDIHRRSITVVEFKQFV
jgi:hypothetical protein